MKKENKEKHFIHKPIYEGGIKAMREFIKSNLKYPLPALENKKEGTVHVRYTINHKGKVIDAKVISGLGDGCDEEAVRLVKLFKFQLEKNRNLRVKFEKKIQIHFRLPKKKTKSEKTVTYQYTTSSTSSKNEDQSSSSTYSYTIDF